MADWLRMLTTAPKAITDPVHRWGEQFAAPTLADADDPDRAWWRGLGAGAAEAAARQLSPLTLASLAAGLVGTGLRIAGPALGAGAELAGSAGAAARPAVAGLRAASRVPVGTTGRWPAMEATDIGRMPADAGAELERALSVLRTLAGQGR